MSKDLSAEQGSDPYLNLDKAEIIPVAEGRVFRIYYPGGRFNLVEASQAERFANRILSQVRSATKAEPEGSPKFQSEAVAEPPCEQSAPCPVCVEYEKRLLDTGYLLGKASQPWPDEPPASPPSSLGVRILPRLDKEKTKNDLDCISRLLYEHRQTHGPTRR
jgi:hypothetical protein